MPMLYQQASECLALRKSGWDWSSSCAHLHLRILKQSSISCADVPAPQMSLYRLILSEGSLWASLSPVH